MKIEVFTLCWNEMAILPWVVDYWKRFASHVTVYDNGSTDGSVEFLQRHGDFVTVRHFDTEGHKSNDAQSLIKNRCWKEARGRADLVCVCDLDEILIIRHDAVFRMLLAGATICEPIWYELVSDKRPEYEEGKLLHELRPMAAMAKVSPRMPTPSKAVLFDPNKIEEINYGPGAHRCDPKGDVRWYGGDIYVLHINNSLSLEYKLDRYRQQRERLSEADKKKGYGKHYQMSENDICNEWIHAHSQRVNFAKLIE